LPHLRQTKQQCSCVMYSMYALHRAINNHDKYNIIFVFVRLIIIML